MDQNEASFLHVFGYCLEEMNTPEENSIAAKMDLISSKVGA
jgi:hypothetical protein